MREPAMKRYFAAALVAAFVAELPCVAQAHAMLAHAMPPVGSSQNAAPREVVLSFTEDLEPAFSSIEVRSENGAVVSSGNAHVDTKLHTQLKVALKPLPPGTYKVIWRVLSVDTHRTQGDFTFKVGP
jgi:methionine-rich copper-binding protein CopC